MFISMAINPFLKLILKGTVVSKKRMELHFSFYDVAINSLGA